MPRDVSQPSSVPAPVVTGQHRNWVFTLNNPTEEHVVALRGLGESTSTKYFRCKPERGESGTLHLQGLVQFRNGRTFEGVRRSLEGAHIEVMRGTISQALDYVEKEEGDATIDFPSGNIEIGSRPPAGSGGQGSRSDLLVLYEAARDGKRGRDLIEANPEAFIKFARGIEAVVGCYEDRRAFKTEIRWYYGPTGTGKSKTAYEEAEALGSFYVKDPTSNWWDGYAGEHSCIIDDYRRDFCTFSSLLRLFDRYPLPVQVKGGYRQFRSKVIFITTPKNPQDTWESRTQEDISQLMRRIETVKHFINFFNNV